MLRGVKSLLAILAILAVAGMLTGCAATWPVIQEEVEEVDPWAITGEQGLSGEVKKLVQKGQALYEGGQYTEGVESFKLAAELDPENVSVLASLGYGQSRAGQYVDAVESFEIALELEPKDKGLKSSYAYNLGMAGDMEKSEQIYREIAAENPYDERVYKNLAIAYAQNQRLPQAIMAYSKSLEINQEDWESLETVGKICRDARPPVLLPAVAAFERIRSKHDDDTKRMEATHSLGWLYVQSNTHCKAADMYAMVDDYDPLSKDDRSNYAFALDKCGRTADAIDQYRMVYEADTTDTRFLCRLAFLYKDNDEYAESADLAQEGLRTNPNDACLYCAWGKALEKMNRYEEAITKFEMALTQNDPHWSNYASKQITRQNQLIKIREMRKLQEEYDAQQN
jgi:tetratricopeptide (TPR) repeat protein